MARYIQIPKDLNEIKEKFMFGLTKRQVVCFAIDLFPQLEMGIVKIPCLIDIGSSRFLPQIRKNEQSQNHKIKPLFFITNPIT